MAHVASCRAFVALSLSHPRPRPLTTRHSSRAAHRHVAQGRGCRQGVVDVANRASDAHLIMHKDICSSKALVHLADAVGGQRLALQLQTRRRFSLCIGGRCAGFFTRTGAR